MHRRGHMGRVPPYIDGTAPCDDALGTVRLAQGIPTLWLWGPDAPSVRVRVRVRFGVRVTVTFMSRRRLGVRLRVAKVRGGLAAKQCRIPE